MDGHSKESQGSVCVFCAPGSERPYLLRVVPSTSSQVETCIALEAEASMFLRGLCKREGVKIKEVGPVLATDTPVHTEMQTALNEFMSKK